MKIKILSILLGAGLFFSCSDEIGNTPGQQQENETVTTTINLALEPIRQIETRSVSASDEQGSGLQVIYNAPVQTKAGELEEEMENKITDLWVVQYDLATETKLSERYITDLEKVTNDKATQYKVSTDFLIKNSNNNSFICFIANKGNLGVSWPNTLNGYKSLQHSYADEASVTKDNKLIMTGVYTGPVPIDTDVQLQRLVAKLDLTVYYPGSDILYIDDATLTSVPTIGQYYDESFSSWNWIFPQIESVEYKQHEIYYAENTENNWTRFVWYMPENRRGINNNNTNQKDKIVKNDPSFSEGISYATCIKLGAYYKDEKRIEKCQNHTVSGKK